MVRRYTRAKFGFDAQAALPDGRAGCFEVERDAATYEGERVEQARQIRACDGQSWPLGVYGVAVSWIDTP